jgi:hypothetical protein
VVTRVWREVVILEDVGELDESVLADLLKTVPSLDTDLVLGGPPYQGSRGEAAEPTDSKTRVAKVSLCSCGL